MRTDKETSVSRPLISNQNIIPSANVKTNDFHNVRSKLPQVLFITTFPPRQCGIATYSQDLIASLKNRFSATFNYCICALESDIETHLYSQSPSYILNTDQKADFKVVATAINDRPDITSVVIQHEFGLFAANPIGFSEFYQLITKPIVFSFHTVLPSPSTLLRQHVAQMGEVARSIIVMTNSSSQILHEEYGVSPNKIVVIPHGTHLTTTANKQNLKDKYGLTGRDVLATFGLLSENKGIEVTLLALPAIIQEHPNVLFLILGKTHPTVAKNEGEKYRNMLLDTVEALDLSDHVHFINDYLPLPILLEYLQLTDIYLFTSNDPNQAVSGTFSYAMSAGCPIVSTPIPHAREFIKEDTGLLFDFNDSGQLTDAVLYLLSNPLIGKNISLNALHKMAPTAWENSALAHVNLFMQLQSDERSLQYDLPPINLRHIKNMTTDTGIIQFAKIAEPDLATGYTVDDNARALVALCQLYNRTPDDEHLRLINIYFAFVKSCLQGDGKLLNYVDVGQKATEQNARENLEDSNGRAIWAIGILISFKDMLPSTLIEEAEMLMQKLTLHIEEIHSTRAMAFIIKGLHYQNNPSLRHLIILFADRLIQMFRHERTDEWHWFESYLTYGNCLLPEALLCAHISTRSEVYKYVALESLDFLLSKTFTGDRIAVVSNKGWMHKNIISHKQRGGEQPIDVAYSVMTLEKFYSVFKDNAYKEKAVIAFNWFLGQNHLNQIVYNPHTGGCYDGIEEYNVNLNQGAESTVSYLMARLAIDRITNQ